MQLQLNQIKQLAYKHGWKFIDYQENIGMVSFEKAKELIKCN